jgi:hypothetical protein
MQLSFIAGCEIKMKTKLVSIVLITAVICAGLIMLTEAGASTVTAPEEEWSRTFGGAEDDFADKDDEAHSVQQTSDGGYILAGWTESYAGEFDFWLVKTDSNGNKEWDKTFGGDSNAEAHSVQQTSDGGYILAGLTSYGADDFWLVKTDSNGNKEWDKTFGGDRDDEAHSVQQTSDGGYILAGCTCSYGGGDDFWLVKTDSNGNKEWDKTFGEDSYHERAYSVQQTSDGGYILAGWTYSGAYICDFWLVKTDSNGNKEWDKTSRGDSDKERAWSVQQTSDGGYILAGETDACGADESDVWLSKLEGTGEVPATEKSSVAPDIEKPPEKSIPGFGALVGAFAVFAIFFILRRRA